MHRGITILLIASALVTVHSDVRKCYMCTSLSDKGCDSALTSSSLQPMECTSNRISEWQRTIQQHRVLNSIVGVIEVDALQLQHYYQRNHQDSMACAKMVLNVDNREVVVRNCQIPEMEHINPCDTMKEKIESNQRDKMEHCSLCLKDACNGTTAVTPGFFYTLLPFLAAFIRVAFYHSA